MRLYCTNLLLLCHCGLQLLLAVIQQHTVYSWPCKGICLSVMCNPVAATHHRGSSSLGPVYGAVQRAL
jgi:hypothetical protein